MPGLQQTHAAINRLDRLVIGRVMMALLLLTGTGLSLLFIPASLRQLAEPGTLVYHEDGFRRLALALTPARLLGLRLALAAVTLLSLGGWLAILRRGSGLIRLQLRHAGTRLHCYWTRLPPGGRRNAVLLMVLVIIVRLYYLVAYPLSTDEIASFDYFVRQGPRVIFSYYPIPNNHLLFNLLAWPLSLTGIPPLLVMRLPTWVLGSASLPLTLALLGRVAGGRRALLVTGLMGLTPLNAYYEAVGRGYGLQLVMLQLGFFAVLELLRPESSYRQLAWAALVSSSVAGLLLVPSYTYPLAALQLALAVGTYRAHGWPALWCVVLAATAIGLTTLLLYSPVGTVSGWGRLLANRYVASRAASQFWPGFRPRLYEVAAELFAPSVRVSGPLWMGIAVLGGAISWQALSGFRRRAALVAWLLVALPIGLLAAQRVFPLARVLLYVPWAGSVWLLLSLPRVKIVGVAGLWATQLVLGSLVALGVYRLYLNESQLLGAQHETYLIQQAYNWLHKAAPTGTTPQLVGLQAPIHELFFAHNLTGSPGPSFRLISYRTTQPPAQYDFIVLSHAAVAAGRSVPAPYFASYSDALVTIYAKPTPRRQPVRTP